MDLQDDGYSQSTISKVRGLLFQMCQAAVANEIISKNVVAYAAKMRYQKTTPRGCFTAEEVSKLMRELPINRDTLSLRLMLVSGLRKQEVMALNRDTIAPDGSYVVVKQAVSRKQGTTFISSAKSEASNRVVPIPERAREYAIMLRDCCTGSLIWESPRKPGKPPARRILMIDTTQRWKVWMCANFPRTALDELLCPSSRLKVFRWKRSVRSADMSM